VEVQEPRRSYGDEGAVARRALGVGGGEDGVHEDERADDLGGEGSPDGVAGGHLVGAATEGVVGVLHDPLHDAHAADGAQALRHDVQQGAHQRQLPPHEQPERHGRVDVPTYIMMQKKVYSTCMPLINQFVVFFVTCMHTWDAAGAVDEDEDGGAEGPGDAEEADTGARFGHGLVLVPDDGRDAHVEEDEGGHELGDERTVQAPLLQLARVQQQGRRRIPVRRLRGGLCLHLDGHVRLRHGFGSFS